MKERPQRTSDDSHAQDPAARVAAARDQDMLEEFPGPELTDPWSDAAPETPRPDDDPDA